MTYEQIEINCIINSRKDRKEIYPASIKIYDGYNNGTKCLHITDKQLIQIFKMFSQYEKDK
jgi:hypothetical protein